MHLRWEQAGGSRLQAEVHVVGADDEMQEALFNRTVQAPSDLTFKY